MPGTAECSVIASHCIACWLQLSLCFLSCALHHCRSVVERLSVPEVRRLFVVDPDTRRMEGIVSLSDVAAYLFDMF